MYREERAFTFRFSLEASFPDDYQGDEDDYAWAAEWDRRIKPAVLKQIFEVLRRQPAWTAHVRNRGLSPAEEIEICLERAITKAESV